MRSRLENRHDRQDTPRRGPERISLGASAMKGAVAGMIGGAAMMMAMKLGQTALVPEEERMDPPPKDEEPRLFFMHFWANDDAVKLARGLRAALDQTNSQRGAAR